MKGFDELNGTDFAVLDAIRRSESSDRSILRHIVAYRGQL